MEEELETQKGSMIEIIGEQKKEREEVQERDRDRKKRVEEGVAMIWEAVELGLGPRRDRNGRQGPNTEIEMEVDAEKDVGQEGIRKGARQEAMEKEMNTIRKERDEAIAETKKLEGQIIFISKEIWKSRDREELEAMREDMKIQKSRELGKDTIGNGAVGKNNLGGAVGTIEGNKTAWERKKAEFMGEPTEETGRYSNYLKKVTAEKRKQQEEREKDRKRGGDGAGFSRGFQGTGRGNQGYQGFQGQNRGGGTVGYNAGGGQRYGQGLGINAGIGQGPSLGLRQGPSFEGTNVGLGQGIGSWGQGPNRGPGPNPGTSFALGFGPSIGGNMGTYVGPRYGQERGYNGQGRGTGDQRGGDFQRSDSNYRGRIGQAGGTRGDRRSFGRGWDQGTGGQGIGSTEIGRLREVEGKIDRLMELMEREQH